MKNNHRDKAVELLARYVAHDTWAELEACVDEIIAAAVQEVLHNETYGLNDVLVELSRRLDNHEQRFRGRPVGE
jgi:hypothetical protein